MRDIRVRALIYESRVKNNSILPPGVEARSRMDKRGRKGGNATEPVRRKRARSIGQAELH
jgi:hypothetical protein